MIQLTQLAQILEDGLNAEKGDLLKTDREEYVFRVILDTTDYKKPTRDGNYVTHYIHGLLVQTGSTIETATVDGPSSASISARLDIIVPVLNGMDDEGNKEIVETVRNILDGYLSRNGTATVQDAENDTLEYSVGYAYSIAASGVRQKIDPIGDFFMFIISIDWSILSNGINASDIIVEWVNPATNTPVSIPYRTFGMMRVAVQESFLPSDTDNGAGKNVTASTVLSINFGLDAVKGTISDLINDFLINGSRTVHTILIYIPSGTGTLSGSYRMRFNEASLNAQMPLIASQTFKMTEEI